MSDFKRYPFHGIMIHRDDPEYLSELSKSLMNKFYTSGNESLSEALAKPAIAFCKGDLDLAQRIYDYCYKQWFMYASPVLSNAPSGEWDFSGDKPVFVSNETKFKGLPISCFAFLVQDSIKGQIEAMQEAGMLSVAGGGTGAHNGIRAVSAKAQGPIPFMKVLDSTIGYFQQGTTRRGALAYYLDVGHPDIQEFVRFRQPGGDPARRSDNRKQFHNAVNLTDEFIEAVLNDKDFDLRCPHSGEVRETVKAREIWEEILETRAFTGEPYLAKIDLINRKLPQSQRDKGLKVHGSNLCSEITLPTDEERTFVCCLSSLNLEKYDEWKETYIVQDLIRFLDNVLEYFIENAPPILEKATNSAKAERALGLGTFGWHAYLQSKMIPFESGGPNSAIHHTHIIYQKIQERAKEESRKLALERGEPEDMIGTGYRNSHLLAIAPNANSADNANTSPSIEPYYRNAFMKDTRAGTYFFKNKYLEALLEEKGKNTEEIWKDIEDNSGSVQHLDFLSDHEKNVFKTAIELDQHWIIEQADARGQYICQAQSLNVFFPSGADRGYVNSVHLKFLKSENVKTMYYYRTENAVKTDNVKKIEREALVDWSGGECIACEG